MNLEEHLLNGIPTADAADFFIRVRGKDKLAQAELEETVEIHRRALHKAAEMVPPAAPPPPPMAGTAAGKNPINATPPALPATGMGQNTSMPKIGSADKSPEEAGRESARRAVAAEHEKNKLHQHTRGGETLGRLMGASLGGEEAARYAKGKHKVLGTVAGAALGMHLGGHVGKRVGEHYDARAHEKSAGAARDFIDAAHSVILNRDTKDAVKRLATGGHRASDAGHVVGKGVKSLPLLAAGGVIEEYNAKKKRNKAHNKHAAAFKLALEQMVEEQAQPQGVVPQLDPAMQQQLLAMQQGDQAAQQNEAMYLRQQLQAAQAQAQTAQQEAQQLQETQAAHDAQTQQYQSQVADSTQKAMAAQDQVLQQQQAAAAMRMAFQQLRGTLLQAASTEPPSLTPGAPGADAAQAAMSQAAGPNSAPSPTAGPAGNAPSPGTAPGSPGPMGDETVSAPSATNEPMFGNAEGTTQIGQTQNGTGREPGKEVLSHYRPFVGEARKFAGVAAAIGQHAKNLRKVAPHAAVGAVLGAGGGALESHTSNEPNKKKLEAALEKSKTKPGLGNTLNIASRRARQTVGEYAAKHPKQMAAVGALGGAITGAVGGPQAVEHLKSIKEDIQAMRAKHT